MRWLVSPNAAENGSDHRPPRDFRRQRQRHLGGWIPEDGTTCAAPRDPAFRRPPLVKGGRRAAQLNGVVAIATDDVWAVGYHWNRRGALIKHWDGTTWSTFPGAMVRGDADLFAVSATSGSDIWAVGYRLSKRGVQPLVEHFDGLFWSLVRTPYAGSYATLDAVTAIATDDVWAVGDGPSASLIEHWDGRMWKIVRHPGIPELYGVSARSARDVWAVGEDGVTEHWDGTMWTLFSIDPPPLPNDHFWAVAVRADGEAWAVGFQGTGPGELPYQVLTERWRDGAWHYAEAPSPDPNVDELRGVIALPGGDAGAAGTAGQPYYAGEPLIEVNSCSSGRSPR
jgi:hypothetical protein